MSPQVLVHSHLSVKFPSPKLTTDMRHTVYGQLSPPQTGRDCCWAMRPRFVGGWRGNPLLAWPAARPALPRPREEGEGTSPERRGFLTSATPGAPEMPSSRVGGHPAVQLTEHRRTSVQHWASGSWGCQPGLGQQKRKSRGTAQEGDPRGAERVETRSFTVFVFKVKPHQTKSQAETPGNRSVYGGTVLAVARPVGFPTISTPQAAPLANLRGSMV